VPAAPSGDRRVERDGGDRFGRDPDASRAAVAVDDFLDVPAKAHRVHDARPLEFPRVAEREPLLRHLVLPAVVDDLPEDAVVVADAIAVRRDAERRHALHVARGEAAQAAVAQRRVRLEPAQPVEIDAEHVERLAHRRCQPEVGHRIDEQSPDQELEREIVDALATGAVGGARRIEPAIDDAVAHGERRRHEPVVIQRVRAILADHVGELAEDRGPHRLGGGGVGRGRARRVVGIVHGTGWAAMALIGDEHIA
jgi:hypothetical protein